VVALPARHVERPHAAHVREVRGLDRVVETGLYSPAGFARLDLLREGRLPSGN
jgi:hypothetical protein